MNIRPIVLPILLGLLAGPSLSAKDVDFGVQGALAIPTGDLADAANLGLQLGGHGRWDFGSGHGLMARADFTFYGSKNSLTTQDFGVGADYTYHLDHNRTGVYLLGGVSMQNYSFSRSGHSWSKSGLGLDLGVGMDVDRHLGGQVRITSHNIDSTTFTSVNLGVTYTF